MESFVNYRRSGYVTESSEYSNDSMPNDDGQATTKSAGSRKNCNRGRWSKEEDELLRMYVQKYGENWDVISSHFRERSDMQCQQRWTKVVDPELVKGPWTKEYGPKKWTLIARNLRGRIGKQCRERWHNHLNPSIKKTAWTEHEDRVIYHAHKQLGPITQLRIIGTRQCGASTSPIVWTRSCSGAGWPGHGRRRRPLPATRGKRVRPR
ncbi:unnamed protein product [Leptidea sinapis]|uniref:Uncharacterized protein n=1 Tax=Leptidea sinapis TaxID=189913 RepID=A0A5E4QLY1_9NEOP|nr:unnamed protein product [Leptidea sinapis]